MQSNGACTNKVDIIIQLVGRFVKELNDSIRTIRLRQVREGNNVEKIETEVIPTE